MPMTPLMGVSEAEAVVLDSDSSGVVGSSNRWESLLASKRPLIC